MVALEVIVNGNKLCDAGIEGLGVLTAVLSSAHRVPQPKAEMNQLYPHDELILEVGGLQSTQNEEPGQHLSWASKVLKIGDTVVINIKSLEIVDPPEKRMREDPQVVKEAKRRYFEELKKEFGE